MAFFIVCAVLLLIALGAGRSVAKNESVSEGLACFSLVLILGGFIGMLLLVGAGSATIGSAEARLLSTETMTVAEGSPFESEYGSISFVEKHSDGTLEPHEIDYSKIEYVSKNIKEIQVLTYELHHSAVFPWTWGNTHHVVIK